MPDAAEFAFETGFINPIWSLPMSFKRDNIRDRLMPVIGEPNFYAYTAYDTVWALTYCARALCLHDAHDGAAPVGFQRLAVVLHLPGVGAVNAPGA